MPNQGCQKAFSPALVDKNSSFEQLPFEGRQEGSYENKRAKMVKIEHFWILYIFAHISYFFLSNWHTLRKIIRLFNFFSSIFSQSSYESKKSEMKKWLAALNIFIVANFNTKSTYFLSRLQRQSEKYCLIWNS